MNVLGIFAATENLPSGTAYRPGDVIQRPQRHDDGDPQYRRRGPSDPLRLRWLRRRAGAGRDRGPRHADRRLRRGARPPRQRAVRQRRGDSPTSCAAPARCRASASGGCRSGQEYDEQIQSTIADIKNTGGRAAGAITAAWFLAHFVDKRPWVHLDIAGTAWTEGGWGQSRPTWRRTPPPASACACSSTSCACGRHSWRRSALGRPSRGPTPVRSPVAWGQAAPPDADRPAGDR